jgi:septal ring factor EnvC (AmiA/AmiB activator)
MRCLQLMGSLGFIVSSAVWASPGQTAPEQAERVASPLPAVHQRVARSKAEVQRLERDLAKQESHSKQASKRLQQQDQAIAELQKQLQELQGQTSSGQH